MDGSGKGFNGYRWGECGCLHEQGQKRLLLWWGVAPKWKTLKGITQQGLQPDEGRRQTVQHDIRICNYAKLVGWCALVKVCSTMKALAALAADFKGGSRNSQGWPSKQQPFFSRPLGLPWHLAKPASFRETPRRPAVLVRIFDCDAPCKPPFSYRPHHGKTKLPRRHIGRVLIESRRRVPTNSSKPCFFREL